MLTADDLKKQGVYFDTFEGTDSRASSPTSTRPRTAQACDKCRERKSKCSGERPRCNRCSSRGLLCRYSVRARRASKPVRVPSPAELEEALPRKRERTHVVGHPPDDRQYTGSITQSFSNSAIAYYQYPVSPGCPGRPNGPPVPDAGATVVPNNASFDYRSVSGPPRFSTNPYSDRSPASQVESGPPSWNMPYVMLPEVPTPAAMGRLDDLPGGITNRDREPNMSRTTFFSGSPYESLCRAPSQSDNFYARKGPSPGTPYDVRNSVCDSHGFSTAAPGFLEYANSFLPSESPQQQPSYPQVHHH